jgi:hypothetical protein
LAVTLTPAQIQSIAVKWASVWFVPGDATKVATMSITDLANAISNVSVSISIGGGSVSMAPSFPPPFNSQPAAAQDDLISYIVQVATGVPLG